MRDWYFLIGHKNDKACFYDLSKNIIHARKPLIVWHRLVVCLLLIVIIFIMGLWGIIKVVLPQKAVAISTLTTP